MTLEHLAEWLRDFAKEGWEPTSLNWAELPETRRERWRAFARKAEEKLNSPAAAGQVTVTEDRVVEALVALAEKEAYRKGDDCPVCGRTCTFCGEEGDIVDGRRKCTNHDCRIFKEDHLRARAEDAEERERTNDYNPTGDNR